MRICVCLAIYNGSEYLQDFLDSLVAQTYENFFVLVRDDCSQDNSLKIIERYKNILNIKYINDSDGNLGSIANFHKIIEHASADLYLLADQDDVWHKNKIKKFHEKIISQELMNTMQPLVFYTNYALIGKNTEKKEILINSNIQQSILFENSIPGCVLGINNNLKYLLITKGDKYFIHDWNLMQLCFLYNGAFIKIDESLVDYRQHENNQVGYVKKDKFTLLKLFKPLLICATVYKIYIDYRHLKMIGVDNKLLGNFLIYLKNKIKWRFEC